MIEQRTTLATPDGQMGCFTVHPDRGGPFPVILFYMDAPGIREELRDMARRLASNGYYVMLPNLYYRAGEEELGVLTTEEEWAHMRVLMRQITIPQIMADTDALLAHAARDPHASDGPAGAVGYCMSGTYAINAMGRHPERILAAASVYGVRLVTDHDDSPHLAARKAKGEIYVAAAETDEFISLEEVERLADDFASNGVNGEVEIYRGVNHGFAFPSRQSYRKPAAEQHWARLLELFRRNLRASN
jgi:carboxymethylenebutenolidase